jgi:hypothetical protein
MRPLEAREVPRLLQVVCIDILQPAAFCENRPLRHLSGCAPAGKCAAHVRLHRTGALKARENNHRMVSSSAIDNQ